MGWEEVERVGEAGGGLDRKREFKAWDSLGVFGRVVCEIGNFPLAHYQSSKVVS